MSKVQYIVLVAYDNVSCCDRCENNMVCVAICDTRKEARDIEKDILMNDKDDHIAFVHIYAGDKVKSLKGWQYGSKS